MIKNKKRNVVIFPEGESQRCGNSILPFKKGMLQLAFDNMIPIQPVSLHYVEQIGFNRNEKIKFFDILTIVDQDVVCEFNDTILPSENETFESYCERVQKSINSTMYREM